MPAALLPDLAAALADGAILLAPSQRAARTLRRAWDSVRQTAGDTLWQAPVILQLDTWFAQLHQSLLLQGRETRIVLNRAQNHALWRSVIVAGMHGEAGLPTLRAPDALADLAARAARLLHLYGGSASSRDFTYATDTRAFGRWSEAFERVCAREGFLAEAQLPAVLNDALAEGALTLPPQGIVLVDFGPLPPAPAAFLRAVEAAGYPVRRVGTDCAAQSAELYPALDDNAELMGAAHWVKQQLELRRDARVAVVVPALAARRAEIDRVFAQTLAPALQPITLGDAPPPYEFSLGVPLAQTAPVAAALALLPWPVEPLPLATISALLLSPSFGASTGPTDPQTLANAAFDARGLRRAKLLSPALSLEALIVLAERSCPGLALRLRRLARAAATDAPPERQPYAAWADHFRSLLEAAGWAPARDSLTFQTVQRWEAVLDELSTLDFAGPARTRAEALGSLARLTRETVFAPESREAPVQILGPLELGGMPFDALWFLGADDLAWPAPAATNPFIPFQLGRTLGMPATDAAREAREAAAFTARIAGSAAQVVFSYAVQSSEGVRRPSPTLEALGLTPFDAPAGAPAASAASLVSIADTAPLPPLPDRVFPGGARVLELQAACPFRAFAELRLHAAQPETREPGFDARERGTLVHTVMETFWAEAATRDNLRDLGEPARHALLDRAIEAALAEAQSTARTAGAFWDAAYLEVQRLRLRQLLRPWLAVELERPNFAVTSHERTLHDVHVGPLRLDLRVDRIDATAGGTLILDYKTGAASPADWLSDRPDAPQLPLYAVVAGQEDFGGVAFASLRAGDDLALKGFAASPAVLSGKPPRMEAATLADQVEQWREHLTALGEAFAAGDVRVDPKRYPHTCTRCTQRILCRLDPASLLRIDDEDTSAPAGYGVANA